MTCDLCRQAQRDWPDMNPSCPGIDKVDECARHTEKVYRLDRANHGFYQFWQLVSPGLHNGMGGFNYDAIDQVCRIHHVPDGQRPILHEKCLVMINEIRKARERDRKSGNT